MERKVFILAVGSAVVVTCLAWALQWLRQLRAVRALRAYGCLVDASCTGSSVTITQRSTGLILGDIGRALLVLHSATLYLLDSSNDDLRQLEPFLMSMKHLWIEIHSQHVTDAGLAYLKNLRNIYLLDVRDTSVTRDGWLNELKDVPCAKVPGRKEWYTSFTNVQDSSSETQERPA